LSHITKQKIQVFLHILIDIPRILVQNCANYFAARCTDIVVLSIGLCTATDYAVAYHKCTSNLYHQALQFGSDKRVTMVCRQEEKYRYGIAQPMHHTLCGIFIYRLNI